MLARLRTTFELTDEGDVGAYLGLGVSRNSAGQYELTQPGLISKIVSECGLQSESNEHKTPALTTLLSSDCTGEQRHHTWSYRMLIGMLNYVASTSRPDIEFAVHQCSRVSANPTRVNEADVKSIIRYLKGTKTKGLFPQSLFGESSRLLC